MFTVIFGLVGGAAGWLSWGYGVEPWRLIWLTLLPIAWGFAQSRCSASFLMLGYYLGGARGLPGGTAVFFGEGGPWWLGYACYFGACLFLTLPFLTLYGQHRRGWRFVIAMCISIVPPLAFVGWINPIAVAGTIFPAMGWIGLIGTAGLMISLVDRSVWILFFAIISAFANYYYVAPTAPAGWTGVDTHFERLGSGGDIGQLVDAQQRVDWLVRYADDVPANNVHILPETVLGPVGDSARFMLTDASARLAKRGSRLLVGGELNKDDGRYQNALLVVGAKKSDDRQAVQGIPVPVSMWHPFGKAGAVADVWGHSGLIHVAGKKTGVLICYEQLLTYSVFWMMTEKPDVLVGASNLWWVADKTIPVIQAQMMQTYGRLFGVGVVRAVNS
jgi:hypothetical protein